MVQLIQASLCPSTLTLGLAIWLALANGIEADVTQILDTQFFSEFSLLAFLWNLLSQ